MARVSVQRSHFTNGGCLPFQAPLRPPTPEWKLPAGRGLHLSPSFLSYSRKNHLSNTGVFPQVVWNMERVLAAD